MYCTKCGHKNPDDYKFCNQCGNPLAPSSDQTKLKFEEPTPPQLTQTEKPEKTTPGPVNQYDEYGNVILPVYDPDPKNKNKKILLWVLAGVLVVGCMIGAFFLFGYWMDKREGQQMEGFAKDFAHKVMINERDSLEKIYPDIILAEELNQELDLKNMVITPLGDSKEKFKVRYSPDVSIIIKKQENGKIRVLESYGLFLYKPDKMEIARKTGLWDDSLNDVELGERMKDRKFFRYIDNLIQKLSSNILTVNTKFTGYGDSDEGYYTITNNTDETLYPSDYEMVFKDGSRYYYNDYGDYVENPPWNYNYYTEPGEEIGPHQTKRIEGSRGYEYESEYVIHQLNGVNMKLSSDELQRRFVKFNGNEYRRYIESEEN